MVMEGVIEGRFFIDGELKDTAVKIENGKITAVGNAVCTGKKISIGDGIILPGFVDPHVHFREPGLTYKEDFKSGTISALFGGVTCVLDMPNTKPPSVDTCSLKHKKAAVRSKAYADYGLFVALTPDCDVERVASGAVGFKMFMGSTTESVVMNDDECIYRAMCEVTKTGKVVSVHAEDDSVIVKGCENDNLDHLRNRPLVAEYSAVERLARYVGMKINICHVSNPIVFQYAKSLGFTTEVTPHHLLLCVEDHSDARCKVNPPLRSREIRDSIFKILTEGGITMFGTDHAPSTINEKSQCYADAPSGIPGVETYIPIFMDLTRRSLFSLPLLVKMGAEMPASVFDIKKGKIAVGYDADFTVFDMRKSVLIDEKYLHSKAGYSPYEGMGAIFPSTVVLRGEIQVLDGEFCGSNIGRDVCDN
ncbi:MAG: dihydroorotase family protein [archaeon]|nr:dihydroorotase family protein [archaeon]